MKASGAYAPISSEAYGDDDHDVEHGNSTATTSVSAVTRAVTTSNSNFRVFIERAKSNPVEMAWGWLKENPKTVAGFIVIATLLTLFFFNAKAVTLVIVRILKWVKQADTLGIVIMLGLIIFFCYPVIPGYSLILLSSGYIYGLSWGLVLTFIGATVGNTSCFLIFRYMCREGVKAKYSRNPRFVAIEIAANQQSFKIVLLTRMTPVPDNILNVLYSLSNVPLSSFLTASSLGMMPFLATQVYIGSLATNLADLAEGNYDKFNLSSLDVGLLTGVVVLAACMTVLANHVTAKAVRAAALSPIPSQQDEEGGEEMGAVIRRDIVVAEEDCGGETYTSQSGSLRTRERDTTELLSAAGGRLSSGNVVLGNRGSDPSDDLGTFSYAGHLRV